MTEPRITGAIVLVGRTHSGQKFRPSNWAERLAISVAKIGSRKQVIYNPRVHISMHEGFHSVVVDRILQDEDPMMFDFFVNFANNNQLELIDR